MLKRTRQFDRLLTSARSPFFWQLVYQTFVFFSRSSISVGLPALPTSLLWIPAMVQSGVLLTLALESAIGIFPEENDPTLTISLVFMLIAVEGVCGGLA